MRFVADFHIHSHYSRATSRDMNIPALAKWAKIKGVDLIGTGDFTHPFWMDELKKYLKPVKSSGIFTYEDENFILSVEISSIYSQNKKVYRVHNIILAPSIDIACRINKMLEGYGSISSDGRPILGLSCIRLAQELFDISDDIMLIPAHIWTPWFSLFGSKSGFNTVEEAFGEYAGKITALETGLSSDPAMNWRLSQLDRYSLVSNSDSHSPARIGREANVFNCRMDYWEIKKVLETKNKDKFLYTVEFFPQEGKYYNDGHRLCKVCFDPVETRKHKGVCPVCNKLLTKGVAYRVDELADRPLGYVPDNAIGYKSMVPFDEIIAESLGVSKTSKKVINNYLEYVKLFESEFYLLIEAKEEELFKKLPEKIALGIKNVRDKEVEVIPGYDGEYGVIKVLEKNK